MVPRLIDAHHDLPSEAARLSALAGSNEGRFLIAIAGVPGSGKTTVAHKLVDAINAIHDGMAALVPMDGFHYPKATLDVMKDLTTAHRRRGAPFTFDAKAMLDLVERIRVVPAQDVLCPGFDHAVGDPITDEHKIPASAYIVVFEGLYLHTAATTAADGDSDPELAAYDNHERVWAAIATHMSERWWMDVSIVTAKTRLASRHVATAVIESAKNAGKVDKVALGKLVNVIAEHTASTVSRDLILAHTFLLVTFHHELRDGESEAKDLAYLCEAESRYGAYMMALAKAVAKDASLIRNVPLPPIDVAMFWHSHMLSPIRYADDVHRCYNADLMQISFPLVRLAKARMGENDKDLAASRQFWADHLPANQPYDLTLADVDETKATATIMCPSCSTVQTLSMAQCAALRLHAQSHSCTSCTTSFTAEHVAVRRFLTLVARVPVVHLAGTLTHPKTLMFAGKYRDNVHDLIELFNKDLWAKHVAALPPLPTWADVKDTVMAPIMVAKADLLVMPGNKLRFVHIMNAHQDVTVGPWSMDMIRAVRRQRRFSTKIASLVDAGTHAMNHFHTEALVQYPKFLAVIVTRPKHGSVPTNAIDLAWHTHQLAPAAYAQQTCALMGTVINHDDSDDEVSETWIADSAKAMPDTWRELFDEEFLAPNVSCLTGAKYAATEMDLAAILQSTNYTSSPAWCGPGRLCSGRCTATCRPLVADGNGESSTAWCGPGRLCSGSCIAKCRP
ncbi:putative kinase [Allomyces arbusculus]|nr:putative kinase [Allomyces arbusculus]